MASNAMPTNATARPVTRRSMQFQVLKTATQIKLRELNAHERKLHAHYAALLAAADAMAPDDASRGDKDDGGAAKRARLDAIYAGIKDLQVVQTKLHPALEDVGALAEFARRDPWSTRQGVAQRERQLRREIRQRRSLWRHNKLLGALLKESLDETEVQALHDGDASVAASSSAAASASVEPEASAAEPLAAMTKEETQARLEAYFFQPSGVRESDVRAFLETRVFQRRAHYSEQQWQRQHTALSAVRLAMRALSERFVTHVKVAASDVQEGIELLLRDKSSFSDEVVAFLTDVKRSEQTQQELAHVLTIELSNLHEFAWPAHGVPVHLQRGMNGRFRCHLQEDAVTLLLFQYVGIQWGRAVKEHLSALLASLDGDDSNGDSASRLPNNSIEMRRRTLQQTFTLAALDTNAPAYDDDDGAANAVASKQDLLRLLCAEARLQGAFEDHIAEADAAAPPRARTRDAPSITAVTTDLEFFGPSVSHEAALACLRFFGVDESMCRVFRDYMRIPLVFPGGEASAPRIMARGVSVGRMMSMFLAEVVLFVMDFSVRAAAGVHLFRRHDDILFYSPDERKVLRAWDAMQQWAEVAGLRFNQDKSGSARLQWSASGSAASTASAGGTSDEPPQLGPAPLPARPIHWGLLELQSDASVRICQDKVRAFATELAGRLAAAASVFGWINAYNTYMVFFLRNFGSASPVFGVAHMDDMLATLQQIHRQVFAATRGDVLASLRDRIARSLAASGLDDDDEIPAAWAQWPLELGGLGLYNPFLAIWSLRPAMLDFQQLYHSRVDAPWPTDRAAWPWRAPFTTAARQFVDQYKVFAEQAAADGLKALHKTTAKRDWFQFTKSSELPDSARAFGASKHNFDASFQVRSLDECVAKLDVAAQTALHNEFSHALTEAEADEPRGPKSAAQTAAEALLESSSSTGNKQLSKPYWRWVALMFSEQIMNEFGTVSFFSKELLPVQLIDTIKKTSVSWSS